MKIKTIKPDFTVSLLRENEATGIVPVRRRSKIWPKWKCGYDALIEANRRANEELQTMLNDPCVPDEKSCTKHFFCRLDREEED